MRVVDKRVAKLLRCIQNKSSSESHDQAFTQDYEGTFTNGVANSKLYNTRASSHSVCACVGRLLRGDGIHDVPPFLFLFFSFLFSLFFSSYLLLVTHRVRVSTHYLFNGYTNNQSFCNGKLQKKKIHEQIAATYLCVQLQY